MTATCSCQPNRSGNRDAALREKAVTVRLQYSEENLVITMNETVNICKIC